MNGSIAMQHLEVAALGSCVMAAGGMAYGASNHWVGQGARASSGPAGTRLVAVLPLQPPLGVQVMAMVLLQSLVVAQVRLSMDYRQYLHGSVLELRSGWIRDRIT